MTFLSYLHRIVVNPDNLLGLLCYKWWLRDQSCSNWLFCPNLRPPHSLPQHSDDTRHVCPHFIGESWSRGPPTCKGTESGVIHRKKEYDTGFGEPWHCICYILYEKCCILFYRLILWHNLFPTYKFFQKILEWLTAKKKKVLALYKVNFCYLQSWLL